MKTWLPLALWFALLAPAWASIQMRHATLDGTTAGAMLVLEFNGDPQIRVTARRASRILILDFPEARLPAGVLRFTKKFDLLEEACLVQMANGDARLALRFSPGSQVSLYHRKDPGSTVSYYTALLQPDDGEVGIAGRGKLTWPVRGRLSSKYGWRMHPILHKERMHHGIDIAVPTGTPIHAVAAGRVVWAADKGGAGLCVIIEHPNGVRSTYMHCSKLLVKVGTQVHRQQVVARAGETGMATGPHLHFSVSAHGTVIDPLRFLKSL
jgi:murein DD-endopeptidase MepM/ murein hydrolase activator NlpD